MTETIEVVPDLIDQQQLAQQLVQAARAEGIELVGPGGLLTGLTKTVAEAAHYPTPRRGTDGAVRADLLQHGHRLVRPARARPRRRNRPPDPGPLVHHED